MAEVVARGTRFHVQQLGSGPHTVVFLHGLVMDNLSSWYFTVANRVAKNAHVLLYDLRGHGRSERTGTSYTVDDMVNDLAAILDAVEVTAPVWLVGNSFGGLLAMAFALAHPNRTAGLVLVDAHLSDAGFGADMAATLGLEGQERNDMIVQSFRHWLGRHSERKRTRLADNAKALVYDTTLVEDLQRSAVFTPPQLAALRVPVLALYGQDSDIREKGQWMAGQLPDCELHVLPGCSHSVLWEATEEVREHIVTWLAGRAV
jgi:pimeloyl-ACP methyl ester carboxylesterase